jgi:antitoxin (DNA-binding transcriptional repressor) of toxin-antitoxin stability system
MRQGAPMKAITVKELRKNFKTCIDLVKNGEEILILEGDTPVARLIPVGAEIADAWREQKAKRP